jgi:hypothetical protein
LGSPPDVVRGQPSDRDRPGKRAIYLSVALWALFAAASETIAEPNKEQYELQERCGKRATEFFEKEYGHRGVSNTETGQSTAQFENHYSPKLNKCFVLVSTMAFENANKTKSYSFDDILIDINDNKIVGEYFQRNNNAAPDMCNVASADCHSKEEWRTLLRPYMED